MESEIVIRNAVLTDLDEIYLFERQYMIEHEPHNLEKWEANKASICSYLETRVDYMFVAVVKNNLLGFAYWDIYEEEPCLYSIYVAKEYRGKGIGFKLLLNVEKQIRDNRLSVITLSTLVTNPAQYLFNKMNYVFIKEKEGWLYYRKNLV